ncbi:MAG: hypothetical protein HOD99_06725 [Planctomycetaceae bacterium]|nr:hypothetical protein [Planctomycetaceae bacterium]
MSYIIQELITECRVLFQKWTKEHHRLSIGTTAVATLLVVMIYWRVHGFITALMWPEPIVFRNFSGSIRYQDDTLIPAHSMSIELSPLSTSDKETGYRRPAYLLVDCSSGNFSGTIQTLGQSAQKTHMYRVVLRNAEGSQLPPNLVPEQFAQFYTSTLCIDVTARDVALHVPKPPTQQLAEFTTEQTP